MSHYCEKCQVKYTASEHHCLEKKICRQCGEEKLIAAFPIHASSMDGHKHTCTICFTASQEADRKRRVANKIQAQQQQEQERLQRAEDNALFRAYGYRWKKEFVAVGDDDFGWWDEEHWQLYTPTGERITSEGAKDAISLLQVHTPGHPSALWALRLCSLPNVVTLDTETTGFGADDEIIDIAIVDIQGRTRLNTLVQCQRASIPKEAKAVHHINELMLRDAPTFPQMWDRLMHFLATREILIYNADYDLRMLQQAAQRYHLPMPELQVHCLMKLYSAYVGQATPSGDGYRNIKLAAACFHFHIPQLNAHRALPDAQASLSLLKKLAEMAGVTGEDR